MVRSRMAVRRRPRARARRLTWAGLTTIPWCLAAGLVLCATADAGQEVGIGATRIGLVALGPATPGDLVPLSATLDGRDDTGPTDADLGDADGALPRADDIAPRIVRKDGVSSAPTVDRHGRGDPSVPVRPTFAAALRVPGALARLRVSTLSFGEGDAASDPAGFAPLPVDAPWADPAQLQPMPRLASATTRPTHAENSPQAQQAGSTAPPVEDGSTPVVARAESLASTTPAAADATPIEIAALPKFSRGPKGLVTESAAAVGIAPSHPDYAALIETAKSPAEQRCLAQAVYFEARSEPEEGQAAVAQVVLNRALSGLYPGSVCGVVFQNQERRNACQFSFACEGHGLRVTEGEPWAQAVRIAREVTDGSTYVSDVGGSTHYHANYVRPAWANALTKTDVIGHHVFYTLKPGQT